MFSSVLIANRGEVACRIARTAKRLGLRTIAIFSAADVGALHVRSCDEAHFVGPAEPRDSYLSIERVIALARQAGAECIHPGYGFLSENALFAAACERAGMAFVGPPANAIAAMGLKDRGKVLAAKAGVPVLPGYHGARQDAKFLAEKARELGFPVLIKPVAGGGGRGLRRVEKASEFGAALETSIREAEAAFGQGAVLLERYVSAPRHIEIQIFADRHGNVIHLGERDCSLQRRHQKVVEEAPAPGMTAELRALMGAAAIKVARAVDYMGAGTVEFIADTAGGLRDGGFWFIEMNTRLQVEHAVTEAVTSLDLVEWQFRIAAGERLPLAQADLRLDGHAVEARLYAEDAENGFLPSTGTIVVLQWPGEVRVESGVEAGDKVTPFYDAMIGKLIAHGPTREAALDRLAGAIDATLIAGPRTNLAFLAALCKTPALREGKTDIGFIDRNLAALGAVPHGPDFGAAASGVAALLSGEPDEQAGDEAATPQDLGDKVNSPWAARDGFQLGGTRTTTLPVDIDGESAVAVVSHGADGVDVTVEAMPPATDARVFRDGGDVYVLRCGRQTRVRLSDFVAPADAAGAAGGIIKAPMHGRIVDILRVGEEVSQGQRLAIIEAMKMEHTLRAPFAGLVVEVAVGTGAQVVDGARIMVIAPAIKG